MPPRHDESDTPRHDESDTPRHLRRPEYWNGISLGNWITIFVCLCSAAASWGALTVRQEAQDKRTDAVVIETKAVDDRRKESFEQVRTDLDRIEGKVDRLLERGSPP